MLRFHASGRNKAIPISGSLLGVIFDLSQGAGPLG